ncbi:MAG: ABC transporter ATP-binding protein [Deltaproteobacteria bacterium]|nr:ABC transporter ATP-binding protein [Deltaproteobacteria bacterium]
MPNRMLLEIRGLKTFFYTCEGVSKAVDGVDLSIGRGETVGIVGESGCGKSVTALSILRLVPDPPGRIVGGEIDFNGKNLLQFKISEMRKVRGDQISMIFQEPMTSLNPLFTIGFQISEILRLHKDLSKGAAWDRSVEVLKMVGIPSPEKRIRDYPHHLSGGMRQRVMIAMSIACEPSLIIADEPTTALDVTIQAQILDIMCDLKEKTGASVLLITHNLGVIADTAAKVVVMYAGKVVEQADVEEIFENPRHPYTAALMKALPYPDEAAGSKKELYVIPGIVPSPAHLPPGCKFHNRCASAFARCEKEEPPLFRIAPGHLARCWLAEKCA